MYTKEDNAMAKRSQECSGAILERRKVDLQGYRTSDDCFAWSVNFPRVTMVSRHQARLFPFVGNNQAIALSP